MKQLIKQFIPKRLFKQIAPYWHLLVAIAANIRYGFPARSMHVVGITGTNGKTTTSFMVQKMLSQAGLKTGLLTTVAYGVDDAITPQIAHMTTVSSPLLQKRLAEFKKQGVQWLVLEATSHALAQNRTWGVPFEIAVLTNITHEHLDYHGSFKAYRRAKQKLFRIAAKHGRQWAIINADDPNAASFAKLSRNITTYGIKTGQLHAKAVSLQPDGVGYQANISTNSYDISCHIPGEFNVYNSLAAVAVGRVAGLTREQIETGIDALEGVEGRMDVVDEGQPFTVIIDFAHTPDSFERLLRDIRESTQGKLVVLFGSAGRRDTAKRGAQGKIAGHYADELVLTEEDDRDEDGIAILEQIAEGAVKSGKKVDKDMFLIGDRTEAIAAALGRVSNANDTVVLLGKGHEKTIERADGEHPWHEMKEVQKVLRKR